MTDEPRIARRRTSAGWRDRLDAWAEARLRRPISHLSPRYVKNRAADVLHRKRHPDHPWINRDAVRIVGSLLRPSDMGIEFGAGRSTTWFAKRVAELVTIEHSAEWARSVLDALAEEGSANVKVHLVEAGVAHEYLAPLADLPDATVDFAFVDGLYRYECVCRSVDLLRPGGFLILDNAERYLPAGSGSPEALRGPVAEEWLEVDRHLSQWRRVWTSNGVCDTAFWFKPC